MGTPRRQGSGVNWLLLIYFCSGMCSLIDEVVWVRLLKLTLGNTVYASSIVVSIFMGGLALGALIMGPRVESVRRKLRLYAILEVFATISALSLPWILRLVDVVYRGFYAKYEPSPGWLLGVQVIISAMVLLVPSMIMGSTLPLLSRYVTALQDQVGRLVGRLYALNMLGATSGCFLAGFVLIRITGVMGTLYIAAMFNLLVALGGWVLSRFYEAGIEPAVAEETVAQAKQSVPASHYILMLAFFSSGLISIGYELIWMRSIIFLLGGFTYVFSAVLTIYLLGNVIGVGIGSRLSKYLKRPAVGFGVSLTCLGISGVFYMPWLTVWYRKVSPNVLGGFGDFFNTHGFKQIISPMLHSVFLFMLPAVVMGIGFPLALQAWSNYRHKVGQTTGTVYGVNTIGAVLGGVITGFVLIPWAGAQLSIVILGLFGIWLGTIMVQIFATRITISRRVIYAAVAVGLTIVAIKMPADLFERHFISIDDTELVVAKEGITTTASVHRLANGESILATSGIRIAGDIKATFRIPQKLLGHLGILLNKNCQRVITIGFGSGETTSCMSLHKIDHIESVEISPELVEVSLQCLSHINLGDRLNEEVKMIYMDAKNYLHLTPKKYDLIVNDCINPKQFADNASLYTKEYFIDAMGHLNSGGIFATYLPVMEMPLSCTDSVLGTMAEVFPYITIWFPVTAPAEYDFWYVAASREPQSFSPKYIDLELQKRRVAESAAYINFENSQYVLSNYIGDQDDLKRHLNRFNLNSDYRPFIEFTLDKNEHKSVKDQWFSQFLAKVRSDSILKYIDWAGMSADDQAKWRQEHKLFYELSTLLLQLHLMHGPILGQLQHSFELLRIMPQHKGLIDQEDMILRYSLQNILRSDSSNEFMLQINAALKSNPSLGSVWLLKSWVLQHRKDFRAALNAAEKAVQHAPYHVQAQNNLAMLLMMKFSNFDKAVQHFAAATRLKPTEAKLHYNLGVALAHQGRTNEAVKEYRKALHLNPHLPQISDEQKAALRQYELNMHIPPD